MIVDFDSSEPKYIPIIVSIIVTVILIVGMTFGLIIYFEAALSDQEMKNEQMYGNYIELDELRKIEDQFLNF